MTFTYFVFFYCKHNFLQNIKSNNYLTSMNFKISKVVLKKCGNLKGRAFFTGSFF